MGVVTIQPWLKHSKHHSRFNPKSDFSLHRHFLKYFFLFWTTASPDTQRSLKSIVQWKFTMWSRGVLQSNTVRAVRVVRANSAESFWLAVRQSLHTQHIIFMPLHALFVVFFLSQWSIIHLHPLTVASNGKLFKGDVLGQKCHILAQNRKILLKNIGHIHVTDKACAISSACQWKT